MIILDKVTKKFGSLSAVDQVSFQVNQNEFFALLGPNGAGKTTIIRMLLGFIKPTSGSVLINGIPVSKINARKKFGYIAEQHMIPPYLSGIDFLLRHASLIGLSGKNALHEVQRVVEIVSMTGKEKNKSSGYSKGMKQRIGIAAAIIGNPKLLLLDEPVSGLDPIGIMDIRNIIENLRSSGLTILLNSHLLSEVEKTCDTIAIMHKGRIVKKDSINSILAHGESLEEVFVNNVTKENK